MRLPRREAWALVGVGLWLCFVAALLLAMVSANAQSGGAAISPTAIAWNLTDSRVWITTWQKEGRDVEFRWFGACRSIPRIVIPPRR